MTATKPHLLEDFDMSIISQDLIYGEIILLRGSFIKSIIKRERLKYSNKEISYYLYAIYLHQSLQINFKSLYLKSKLKISYATYMSNIHALCPLVKVLFFKINERHKIKVSSILNIVDTSLLPSIEGKSIRDRHYKAKQVTVRDGEKICGHKGLFFINRRKQIYSIKLMNINYSDFNILKDSELYRPQLYGVVLADKGFNSLMVRNRVNKLCRFISPYKKKQKLQLSNKEMKIYKYRWNIESLFKKLKDG